MNDIKVAFAGNPNCGKTTLFNAYTGAKLKVANWPGVTVERKDAEMDFKNIHFRMTDTPGAYSLTSYTMEEQVTRNFLTGDNVDAIIDVADASSLERNLYLTLQLIELGKPVVLALNMMDIVEERGMAIDLHRMPEMLGIPVVPVSARKRQGLEILLHAVIHHLENPLDKPQHHHARGAHIHDHHSEYTVVYSDEIEDQIDLVSALLEKKYPKLENYRWYALKTLERDSFVLEAYPIDYIPEKDYEQEIINQRYAFIEEVIAECLVNKDASSANTDKADRLLTHSVWGIPMFLLIMAVVFFLTFTIGDWLKGYFEMFLDFLTGAIGDFLAAVNTSEILISLITDGIIAGVGGILTFLPNIFILFLALAFLEDSGYMSRAAYVMDGLMSRLGLSGRAFIPMLLGFGCTVPAVMASRALENRRDRIKTVLVTPFMSCSARLPIYVLISGMFFGSYAMLAAYSMYIIGMITAIAAAKIMSLADKNHDENTLLIELPEYKLPNLRTVGIYVWDKVRDYLTKAGTTIFIASMILWALLNFGASGLVDSPADSFAAYIGRAAVPFLSLAGLGSWQIAVALISGIAAKEVVVSSMSVLYGISGISSDAGMAALSGILAQSGFTAVNAYSMMLFCLLYIPCIATIATIKRETSWKYALISIIMHLLTAWVVSTLFFQIASRIF